MTINKKTRKKSEFLYGITAEYEDPKYTNSKAYRAEDLLNSVVTVNNINFNADEKSMDRIDRIIDVANFKYNKAVHDGATAAQAYQAVYIDTTVPWKTADNQFVQVTTETLALVQEQALNKMSELWTKYG